MCAINLAKHITATQPWSLLYFLEDTFVKHKKSLWWFKSGVYMVLVLSDSYPNNISGILEDML